MGGGTSERGAVDPVEGPLPRPLPRFDLVAPQQKRDEEHAGGGQREGQRGGGRGKDQERADRRGHEEEQGGRHGGRDKQRRNGPTQRSPPCAGAAGAVPGEDVEQQGEQPASDAGGGAEWPGAGYTYPVHRAPIGALR
ncbi:MAG TPA: hypothetical protein VFN74_16540 [Chloroflexota bacterium]|nr:hypothetical protein [Chloroflexota bacterium]